MDQTRSNQIRTPRETSPYSLMQERYRDSPWALIVGCILFNMVHGNKARPILEIFLWKWPSPETVCGEGLYAFPSMTRLLAPLGFQNRRAERIVRMSNDFLNLRPDLNPGVDVNDLYGVGKYASDSFNMFYRGYLVEDVKDKELRKYVKWAQHQPEGAGESIREVACQAQARGDQSPQGERLGQGEGSEIAAEVFRGGQGTLRVRQADGTLPAAVKGRG